MIRIPVLAFVFLALAVSGLVPVFATTADTSCCCPSESGATACVDCTCAPSCAPSLAAAVLIPPASFPHPTLRETGFFELCGAAEIRYDAPPGPPPKSLI